MKIWNIAEELILHICVSSGIACTILKILDWYNPFMDFEGHGSLIRCLLCVGVPLYAASRKVRRRIRKQNS